MSIRKLQERCGKAAEAKGFHDDRPKPFQDVEGHITYPGLTDWQGNKLMLIVSEVAEAQDELRKGHAADETYYTLPGVAGTYPSTKAARGGHHGPSVNPKPEGVPSELADVVIRVLDFCHTEGIDLQSIIEEKLAYNASRERLHGKKF